MGLGLNGGQGLECEASALRFYPVSPDLTAHPAMESPRPCRSSEWEGLFCFSLP
jgi:hypothetical protein